MTTITPAFRQITSGLRFPEGPVAMPDGSVILVEIERRTLSRVTLDGKTRVIATLGGGPNGAAMGPGGKIYVMVTNVCFGGPGLRTAYATLSMGGTLVSFEWPRPGLPLHYLNRK
jgi:sugar lactone lactonase YvrE